MSQINMLEKRAPRLRIIPIHSEVSMKPRLLFVAVFLSFTFPAFGETGDLETPVAHLRAPPASVAMPYVIEFNRRTTMDFADMTQQAPGPLRGYVYVRMQGELVIIPVYRPDARRDDLAYRAA